MVVVALLLAAPTSAHPNSNHPHPRHCSTVSSIWSLQRWRRGQPKERTAEAFRGCSSWAPAKQRYYRHRKKMRWRERVTPYYGCTVGGCDWWPIPSWSVNCESGGGAVSDNLYGNVETYVPGMSKREQDIAAHKILVTAGYENGWLRWETGCIGWPGP